MKAKLLAIVMMLSWATYGQSLIKGRVTDENDQGLPGVNVLIKGTAQGTVTDGQGEYVFENPPADAVLVVSFIGYLTQEVSIAGKSTVDIKLAPDIQALEEVVVVGYGEQKKSLVTGAISSVKSDELKTVSLGRIDQALQGRTSGVSITPTSGSPGSGTKIRIRGTGSNMSANPLYIIDGVRSGADGMDYLSPTEIASIEVLKDAASAAIYGAEGANGVVIVTTKKGRANTSEITYSGQVGVQSVRPNMMKMMNAQQYQQYMDEAGVNGPTEADLAAAGGSTDWLDALFENAPQQNHSLTFSGGTEKSTYFIGGTMFRQEGIAGGDKAQFNRYTLRINTNHKLKEWLTIGENLSYANIQKRTLSEDTEYGSLVGSAIALDPITPLTYAGVNPLPGHVLSALGGTTGDGTPIGPLLARDEQGNYYGISNWVRGEFGNPLAQIDLSKGKTVQNKILGNIYAEISPLKGFKFTTRLGIDAAFQRNHDWNPTFWFSSESLNTKANGSDNWEEWFTWQWENFASYDKIIGDHHFTVLVGGSVQEYTRNQAEGSYSGLFREEDKWSYGEFVPDNLDKMSSELETRGLTSYFGRISYDYMDKYLFNATFRRDGSSMLAKGQQWGTFPSASVGWVFSNEDFFPEQLNVMSYAKVRASWGENGSLANLRPGQWQRAISTNVGGVIRYPDALGTYVIGAAPTNLENPYLTWETSEQVDVGLDLRFFNDQLTFTTDYFKKTTKDLITRGAPPGFAGNTIPYFNGGDVVNKGWEFEIGYQNPESQALQYGIALNFTTLKNEVTYLNRDVGKIDGASVGTGWGAATQFRQGQPIWYFNGYKTNGILQTQEQVDEYLAGGLENYPAKVGWPVIVDVNADNKINSDDFTKIGSPHPDFYFGTRLNVSYKGFDFLVFLQGQLGNDIIMGFNRTDRQTANKPAFFFEDRWTGNGSTNSWFAANTDNNQIYSSDLMVFDGSYARIRQMQLGYTLPNAITEKLRIKNARVYISLDNYFTFTDYPGLDPEAGSNNDNSQGIDRGVYPIPRTALGGLSFTF